MPGAASRAALPKAIHAQYVLRLADTSLILAQRLGEWVGHAPALEEDLGLGNLALDMLGQARLLLTHAGRLDGTGRSEDELAFFRDGPQFHNLTLAEQPNGDFAHSLVRQYFIDAWQVPMFQALSGSVDADLAAIAAKSLKEARYHHRFSSGWLVRMGDGTAESHARTQAAVDSLIRFTPEMFEPDAVDQQSLEAGIGADLREVRAAWLADARRVFSEATLRLPEASSGAPVGKRGAHSEYLGYLLTELQFMQRAYPGAEW